MLTASCMTTGPTALLNTVCSAELVFPQSLNDKCTACEAPYLQKRLTSEPLPFRFMYHSIQFHARFLYHTAVLVGFPNHNVQYHGLFLPQTALLMGFAQVF